LSISFAYRTFGSITGDRVKLGGIPMRGLFAALRRKIVWPPSAAREPGPQNTLFIFVNEDPEKQSFTLGSRPPGGVAIEYLTLSAERSNDPCWLEMVRRTLNLRFAGEAQPDSPGDPRDNRPS
jgi:hypothetical protein